MVLLRYRPQLGQSVPSGIIVNEQTKGDAVAQVYAQEKLLTPSEVAAMFRVNPKTVTRWARAGRINAIRTLGGHRRFRAAEVIAALADMEEHMGGIADEA